MNTLSLDEIPVTGRARHRSEMVPCERHESSYGGGFSNVVVTMHLPRLAVSSRVQPLAVWRGVN
eukprot:16435338-Heterocapsa_arctica.AAC.1